MTIRKKGFKQLFLIIFMKLETKLEAKNLARKVLNTNASIIPKLLVCRMDFIDTTQ